MKIEYERQSKLKRVLKASKKTLPEKPKGITDVGNRSVSGDVQAIWSEILLQQGEERILKGEMAKIRRLRTIIVKGDMRSTCHCKRLRN